MQKPCLFKLQNALFCRATTKIAGQNRVVNYAVVCLISFWLSD